jgi:hypothetical protein
MIGWNSQGADVGDALILAAYFFIGMWRVTGDKQVDDQAMWDTQTARYSD